MRAIAKLKDMITTARDILLITHVNPDGDAVGSTLALLYALKNSGKDAAAVCDGKVMDKYAFLSKAGEILKPQGMDRSFELAIAIDCADKNRLGEADKLFFKAGKNANIDHHAMNEMFGGINIVREASSSAEIIYDLVLSLGFEIDTVCAECLYTAISTDTGNCTYSNTTKKSLLIASKLIGLFDFSKTADYLYRTRSYENTRLIAKAIDNLTLHEKQRISFMYMSFKDLNNAKIKNPDYEMLINYASEIDTVKIAVFMRELKDGSYKISLRSKGDIDVSELCMKYNGGGHKNASGCMLRASFEEAKKTMLDETAKLLGR